jgi:RpiB/LacA/LacB family sugar-phosphate isomerase
MRFALGADHAGYEIKDDLIARLDGQGRVVLDLGKHGPEPVDYSDFAEAVGRAVLDGRADRGIIVCGSGVGASVAANKLTGIRAGLTHDTYSARQGVEHDDMNVLVLGGRVIGQEVARELASAFSNAVFSGEERHLRRLAKVRAIEARQHDSKKETQA